MPLELDARTRDFYRLAMTALQKSSIPFLVGGAYALERYTGIERHTKDLDLFVRPGEVERIFAVFSGLGYRSELTHPHWLGKVYSDDAFIDVIFRSGNGVAEVDNRWFEHSVPEQVFGLDVGLCPVEEILWSKGFVMERERFDGADMAHLLHARAETLDWARLLDRFGADWRVLLSHLTLFGYVYPAERSKIPAWVMKDLLARLRDELEVPDPKPRERTCQGTLLSRSQYLFDLERWGYQDARLEPRGLMTSTEITLWTKAIERDGSV